MTLSRRKLAAYFVVFVAAVASLATSPKRWSMTRSAPFKQTVSKVKPKITKAYELRSSHQQNVSYSGRFAWRGTPSPTARVQIDLVGRDGAGARQTRTRSIDTAANSGSFEVSLPSLACATPPCVASYDLKIELLNFAATDAIELDGALVGEIRGTGSDTPPSANLILIEK